ncbi:MAG: helix-turn-helix domain-containing protein [Chloroflexota bacterium]
MATVLPSPATTLAPDDLPGALRAALDEAASWVTDEDGEPGDEVRAVAVGILSGPDIADLLVSPSVDPEVARELAVRLVAGGPAAGGGVGVDARDGAVWCGRWTPVGDGRQAFALARSPVPMPEPGARDDGRAAPVVAALLAVVRAALLATDRRRSEQLAQLQTTARRVTESLELATVLTSIVEDASTLLQADSGDMLLWDRQREKLRVVAVSRYGTDMLGLELDFGQGLSTQAILTQRTFWVDDYATYEHRARQLDHYDFGAVICAPLLFRGEAIGAINLHRNQGGPRFGPADADLLAAFAGHGAIAIDHARRYENEVRLGRDLAASNRELSRSLTVQQRLAEQVLLDGGPAGIAAVLAGDLGRSVVIMDRIRRVIAGASPGGGDAWQALAERSRFGGPAGRGPAGESEPFSVAVRVGREVAGHLVLSAEEDLDPVDRALIDVAVTGVALEFAKVRASLEVEERLRGEAITDLLAGIYPDEDAIAGRAARLGHDLTQPHDVLVVGLLAQGDGAGRSSLDAVREGLVPRVPRSIAVVHAGTLVILAAHPGRGDLDPRALATDIQSWLRGGDPAAPTLPSIALGGTCRRPDDYAPAFATSREALDLMRKLGRHGAVVGARELGPYGLLLRASSREDLETFARDRLAPLLEHDTRHGAELLRTLRTYLEEDRVQRRVAERCFIHVNTVVYRINRIQELLGARLDDAATVFDLTLALRILDLIDEPAARPSADVLRGLGPGDPRSDERAGLPAHRLRRRPKDPPD